MKQAYVHSSKVLISERIQMLEDRPVENNIKLTSYIESECNIVCDNAKLLRKTVEFLKLIYTATRTNVIMISC